MMRQEVCGVLFALFTPLFLLAYHLAQTEFWILFLPAFLLFIPVYCCFVLCCTPCIMLSLSLRRRRAPPSTDGPASPGGDSPSPSRARNSPFSSVSSRRSLPALIFKRQGSESPSKNEESKVNGLAVDETADRSSHNHSHAVSATPPVTPSILSRKRSRSLSRSRSGSVSDSKNIFGFVAGSLRAVAGLLHKEAPEPAKAATDHLQPSKSPGTFKLSPGKVVRFQADANGHEKAGSSPVDIPKKTAPSLPPLHLSTALNMGPEGNPINDAILTARPPDTPVLKALVTEDYFSPLHSGQDASNYENLSIRDDNFDPIPSKLHMHEHARASPSISKQDLNESGGQPLLDAASVLEPGNDPLPGLTGSGTDEKKSSATTFEVSGDEHSKLHLANPSDSIHASSNINECAAAKDPFSDHAESDIFSQRGLPNSATHEDIRHRFRIKSSPDISDGWYSPTSDSTDAHTPREVCEASLGPILQGQQEPTSLQPRPLLASADDSEVSAVRKELESMSLTDPVKSSKLMSFDRPGFATVASELVGPPQTLKPTMSSTSPSRSRRPFRYSNEAKPKPKVESVGKTSSSWIDHGPGKTPSPVSVPRPLSIPPKKILGINLESHLPAWLSGTPKWSPFDEPGFPYALTVATSDGVGINNANEVLSRTGGFAKLWTALVLPKWTAPPKSIPALDAKEISDMIRKARDICKSPASRVDHYGWSPFDEVLFPSALVCTNHAMGLGTIHNFLSVSGGFTKLWREMDLPPKTAPKEDTQVLNYDECEKMVRKAWQHCGHSALLADQYGWLPFYETQFPYTLLSAISAVGEDHVREFLIDEGGFAKFWQHFGLPKSTAPKEDTRGLSIEEIARMIEQSRKVCGYSLALNADDSEVDRTMATLHSSYLSSNRNYFSPLGSADMASSADVQSFADMASDSCRRHQQYSGEVSTVNLSMDGDEGYHSQENREGGGNFEFSSSHDKARTSDEDSQASDGKPSSAWECASNEDEAGAPPPPNTPLRTTPTSQVASEGLTPRQNDYAGMQATRSFGQPRFTSRRLTGSEDSGLSTTSSLGYSEDERFAKNII